MDFATNGPAQNQPNGIDMWRKRLHVERKGESEQDRFCPDFRSFLGPNEEASPEQSQPNTL